MSQGPSSLAHPLKLIPGRKNWKAKKNFGIAAFQNWLSFLLCLLTLGSSTSIDSANHTPNRPGPLPCCSYLHSLKHELQQLHLLYLHTTSECLWADCKGQAEWGSAGSLNRSVYLRCLKKKKSLWARYCPDTHLSVLALNSAVIQKFWKADFQSCLVPPFTVISAGTAHSLCYYILQTPGNAGRR